MIKEFRIKYFFSENDMNHSLQTPNFLISISLQPYLLVLLYLILCKNFYEKFKFVPVLFQWLFLDQISFETK